MSYNFVMQVPKIVHFTEVEPQVTNHSKKISMCTNYCICCDMLAAQFYKELYVSSKIVIAHQGRQYLYVLECP